MKLISLADLKLYVNWYRMQNMVIRGKVKQGKQRGEKLGFPTANIPLHTLIPEGVYISTTKTNNKVYKSLTFIGKAETFGEKIYQAESYLFEFNDNLYNKLITIALIKKIRESKKFSSKEDLIAQIKRDKDLAEEYFKRNS